MNVYRKPRDTRKHDTRATAIRCRSCREFTVGPEMGLCPRCMKPPAPREYNDVRLRSVRVLKCPKGEFKPGATFTLSEFRFGLHDGTWPLGMIVRAEDGDIVCVCGRGKAYREPVGVLPREWVVAL